MKESDARSRAFAHIDAHRSELVRFLSSYVQHNSVNPDLDETGEAFSCQRWLADEMSASKAFAKVDFWAESDKYANVVANLKGNGGGRSLLLAGHTDTVPITAEQVQMWRKDAGPLSGAVVDGKLWGRGASDMKGGSAAAIMAAIALAKSGVKLKGDAYLSFVMTEETGNRKFGVDAIVDRGYSADACLVMEPTDLTVTPAVNGEFYFKLKIKGRSAHIAARHLSIYPGKPNPGSAPGFNAIEKAVKFIQAFQDLERELGLHIQHPLMEPGATTINVSGIKGGGIFSAMAEECEIVGSMLYCPIMSESEAKAEFRRAIDRVVQGDFWLREHPPALELPHLLPSKPPINTSADHPLCVALQSGLRQQGVTNVDCAVMISTTDGNYFVDRGLDVVTFGPGAISMGTHSYDEHIPVEQYITAAKVFASAMIDWCGIES
jgi:acetylornithine deacetylase